MSLVTPQMAQMDDDGSNILTPQELDAINREFQKELSETTRLNTNPVSYNVTDPAKLQMIKNSIVKLKNVPGKIRKNLVSAISAYNVTQRRYDNFDPLLKRGQQSGYPCGTITCKQRGKKIKKALLELSQIDEHALGSIGVYEVIALGMNHLGSTAIEATKKVGDVASSSISSMYKSWTGSGTRKLKKRR